MLPANLYGVIGSFIFLYISVNLVEGGKAMCLLILSAAAAFSHSLDGVQLAWVFCHSFLKD